MLVSTVQITIDMNLSVDVAICSHAFRIRLLRFNNIARLYLPTFFFIRTNLGVATRFLIVKYVNYQGPLLLDRKIGRQSVPKTCC